MWGSFRKNPWVAEEDVDLYSSFYLCSRMNAWLDDGGAGVELAAGGEPLVVGLGLWAMNDADLVVGPSVGGESELGFVQVDAMEPAGTRSLPLTSFTRCAVDGCNRFGVVQVQRYDFLLPLQVIRSAGRARWAPVPAMVTGGWFGYESPADRRWVTIEVVLPRGEDTERHAERLRGGLTSVDVGAFTLHEVSRAPLRASTPRPFVHHLDDPLSDDAICVRGELTAWNPEAVGWAGELVSDLLVQQGVSAPVTLSVSLQVPGLSGEGSP